MTTQAKLLTLKDEVEVKVLILFTSSARAKNFVKDHSG